MSSLTNNTPNRILSSSITNTNTTYPQLASSFDNPTNNNTGNDCTGSVSSPPSSSSTTTGATGNPLGLAAMGLTAASLNSTTTNSDNAECDSKQRHVSTPFKIHSNISDDPYASFYALNRTLPSPSSNPTGALPFNLINQSSHNNLPFAPNPTGSFFHSNQNPSLSIR